MPAIIAHHIARQIALHPTEHDVRQVVTTGIRTAAASGYDAEVSAIFVELCEDLRELIADETDPQRRSGLQASLDLVGSLADEYGAPSPPAAATRDDRTPYPDC